MSDLVFETRLCLSCGLRYPVEKSHTYSMRCPQCLGETEMVSQKVIHEEEKTRIKTDKKNKTQRGVLLDNIRSAWNVGSILRSADGLGFDQVYLCGITPTPENEAVLKTSLGAEKTIQWSYHKNAVEVVKDLKVEGWKVYALEEDKRAVELRTDSREQRTEGNTQKSVLIVGSEVTGVDNELLNLCDAIFYIPMQGEKRSLNVAIAFSIAAFLLRK
jgi:23S rRNA (guanosine2251-2'-O)-methyltransferase